MYGQTAWDRRRNSLTLSEPVPWPIGEPPAALYCDEDRRLAALASFQFDTLEGDQELARKARFAAHLCNAPTAMISLVEAERQLFLATSGTDITETPRATSMCATTMLAGELLEVLDASEDERFADFSLVKGDAKLRYYAGAPIISSEGAPLGALCVIDTKPRTEPLNDLQREGLFVIAEGVKRRLENKREAARALAEIKLGAQRVQFVLDSVPDIAWSAAPGGHFDYFNARWEKVTGLPAPTNVEDWRQVIHPDEYDQSLKRFMASVKKAELFEDEWRMRQKDGSYRWVLSRAVPSTHDPETARWYGTLTDIDDAYRISQERELLAGELAHRIKNIFSVIIGLIALHSRGDETAKLFADVLSENIRALARAQEFALQIGNPSEDMLAKLLGVLMAPYGIPGHGAVSITGDDVPTGRKAATPLALAFHELATNSAKYGALSEADGKLAIKISRQDENISIRWTESGGPPALKPEDSGFGSRLIEMAIGRQLGGSIEFDWREQGLRAVITIPVERLAQ